MSDDLAKEAERKTDEAIAASGGRDPREFYRERLRDLKAADAAAYDRAVQYYQDVLIPEVAEGDGDPLLAWTEYGRRLAEALKPGRTVRIDEHGRAHDYDGPTRAELLLHLPDARGARALLVGLPEELSPAQRATYDTLVARKHRLRDA